jgi:hypothetical protein
MMDAAGTSESLVPIYENTNVIPGNCNPNIQYCKNLEHHTAHSVSSVHVNCKSVKTGLNHVELKYLPECTMNTQNAE